MCIPAFLELCDSYSIIVKNRKLYLFDKSVRSLNYPVLVADIWRNSVFYLPCTTHSSKGAAHLWYGGRGICSPTLELETRF
jgi:hypothetical protein